MLSCISADVIPCRHNVIVPGFARTIWRVIMPITTRNEFRKFHGQVRRHFRDAQGAGFERCLNNVRAAGERFGFGLEQSKALWEKCYNPSIIPNGRLLSLNEHLDCSLNPY